MYKQILVPLDGSELSEIALPYAEELAGKLDSHVTLLHIAKSNRNQDDRLLQFYMQKMVQTTALNTQKYGTASSKKEVKVTSAILVGYPEEEIITFADRKHMSLIVMATHGSSGFKRWALGSVSNKVVRAVANPVLLIRAKDARNEQLRKRSLNKILVPLDGSVESESVIPHIEELAPKLGAEVTLFQSVSQAYLVVTGGDGAIQIPYSPEEMGPIVANAENYIGKITALLKSKGIATKSELRIGEAAEEIIGLADELQVDLVAMSTHGRSGISRWSFGSVADKVLHAGSTPLMLVRTQGTGSY